MENFYFNILDNAILQNLCGRISLTPESRIESNRTPEHGLSKPVKKIKQFSYEKFEGTNNACDRSDEYLKHITLKFINF